MVATYKYAIRLGRKGRETTVWKGNSREAGDAALREIRAGNPLRAVRLINREKALRRNAAAQACIPREEPETRKELAARLHRERFEAVIARALAKGWKIEDRSKSGSLYLRTPHGYLVRLADHMIPLTEERMVKWNRGQGKRPWKRDLIID